MIISARALVVFESAFGDTDQVASSVAVGRARRLEVDLVEAISARCCLPRCRAQRPAAATPRPIGP
jgi:hypothetical protein